MGVSTMNMVMYYDEVDKRKKATQEYFDEVDKRKKLMKEIDNFFDQYDILVDRYNYYDSENEEFVIPTREIGILMRDFAKTVKEC